MRRDSLNIHLRDIEPASAHWLPYARKKLLALWESDRAKAGYNREIIGDVTITVWWHMAQGYIRIEGGSCPEFVSGLLDPQVPSATALEEIRPGGEIVEKFSRWYQRPTDEGAKQKWENSYFLRNIQPEILSVRPAMFSGLMRAVCQDHLSRGFAIPYSYTYQTTHGIYLASNGQPWVIEIGTQGVFAWRLRTCGSRTKRMNGLDFLPLPSPKPPKPILLANAAGIAQFYAGRQAVFDGCGWAFSYSGAKASNVLLKTSGSYYRSFVAHITINENPDTKKPATISLSETGEEWLWTDKVTHFKYPDYITGKLKSFSTVPPISAPAPTYECYVGVWYEGEVMKSVKYGRFTDETASAQPDPADGTVTGSLGTWRDTSATVNRTGFITPLGSAETVVSYNGNEYTRFIERDWGICTTGGFNAFYSYAELVNVCTYRRNAPFSESGVNIVVFTYGDRESFAFYQHKDRHWLAGGEVQQCVNGLLGQACRGGATGSPRVALTYCPGSCCDELGSPGRDCYPIGWPEYPNMAACADEDRFFGFNGGWMGCGDLERNGCPGTHPDYADQWMHCLDTCEREFHSSEADFLNRPSPEETVSLYEAAIWSDGKGYDLPNPGADAGQWEAFIEDDTFQIILSAPDFSHTVGPIYSKKMITAEDVLGQSILHGAPTNNYPIEEISRQLFCWVGNPKEPANA